MYVFRQANDFRKTLSSRKSNDGVLSVNSECITAIFPGYCLDVCWGSNRFFMVEHSFYSAKLVVIICLIAGYYQWATARGKNTKNTQ